jgi:hypothetical protein
VTRALLVLAAAALVAAAAPAPAFAEEGPRLRAEPPAFDFGRTLPGRTLRKEFTLKNLGDRELVIDGVSTTCGCTAAVAGEKTVPPGRSTPLAVTLQTRDYRGRVERKVLVRSNDAKTPLLEITVQATVEPAAKP